VISLIRDSGEARILMSSEWDVVTRSLTPATVQVLCERGMGN